MSDARLTVQLSEWQRVGPQEDTMLRGRCLESTPAMHRMVELLSNSRLLSLTELRSGLEIRAFSHAGRIRVGDLEISVRPKIPGRSLVSLIRYAYGYRRLKLISDTVQELDNYGFEDLLITQLNAEISELITRGLRRSYQRRSENLASPRGRLDIDRFAMNQANCSATLPCTHHPRTSNILLNQILFAGLHLAASMTSHIEISRESLRLASLLSDEISKVELRPTLLKQAFQQMSRLTESYQPALSIIKQLVESQGIVLDDGPVQHTFPGFLFDMNLFFQMLLSRLLRENLPGFHVIDERGLIGMMRYDPAFNPRRARTPTPRPDFIVGRDGQTFSILDAKYRDLWEHNLPREMLYQLVVYAISCRERACSSILYPTTDLRARESRIDVTAPLDGHRIGQVCLRPVHLPTVVELVTSRSRQSYQERVAYVKKLAFGADDGK
ncbi:restriction endonuclease [bacterium]|nr:restriction endonuclease [bacterium]